MFERKFEFTVHQPLEVCEEQIRQMGSSIRFLLISTNIFPKKYDGSRKIYVKQSFGGKDKVSIDAILEVIDSTNSRVSGIASLHGYQDEVWFYGCLACILDITFIVGGYWWAIMVITFIWLVLTASYLIPELTQRDELINELEKALTQPKKKKNEVV